MDEKGYLIGNIDAVVILEQPKLSPHRKKIRESISGLLGVALKDVSIKGKTNEGIGEIGAKNAIAAYVVAMLKMKNDS